MKIGTNSQVLVQHTGNWSAPKYFYMHDRLGNVRQVLDYVAGRSPAIQAKNIYTYDAFGKRLTGSASPWDTYETVYNPFQFTGQWYDAEIGQYYLRARQYDPAMMRFTSRDPVGGKYTEPQGLHKYLYTTNDPLDRVDLTGKFSWQIFGALIAGTAVRAAATYAVAVGDWLFNLGLDMHHLIAPAMYFGAAMGPHLPAIGGVAARGAIAL